MINIKYRMDGKVFNLSRLCSINLTTITSLCAFEYADDNSVASHTEAGLQATLEAFNFAYTKLGLNINRGKTQVLHQPCPNDANPQPPAIVLQRQTLENVEHFCYLGSHLSSKADRDIEIQHRLQGAGTAFGKLRTRVFRNRDLQIETKIRVYRAIVIPTLLYGSETWTTYSRHIKMLERFHQRCLRAILHVTWEDYRTNVSVLEETSTSSIETLIVKSQLRWAGHVVRMEENRLPKQMFCSEMEMGHRTRGGQKKRFKDKLKQNL